MNKSNIILDAGSGNQSFVSTDDKLRKIPQISIVTSVCCCFILSLIYVASLYVWNTKENRDHPSTIKRRFLSVAVVMLIAPVFVYMFSSPELLTNVPFPELIGLKFQGLAQAIFIPYLLTAVLFLGPLCVQMQNENMRVYLDIDYWINSFRNIIWLRNHIVAPLSEEFVFRACMMPLILQSFTPIQSVFVTPLFFGVAHVHHIAEWLSLGVGFGTALLVALFQFAYTTIFGFYSSYLFARTGHIIAPFLVHAFCNHMGLPDLQDLWQRHLLRRILSIACYIIGFVCWMLLLPIATDPKLYSNHLYWNTYNKLL